MTRICPARHSPEEANEPAPQQRTNHSLESQRSGKRLHDERGAMARALSAGSCTTGTDINDLGLWICTRQQMRNDTLMERVREIVSAKSLDLAALGSVQQQLGCDATDIVDAKD